MTGSNLNALNSNVQKSQKNCHILSLSVKGDL